MHPMKAKLTMISHSCLHHLRWPYVCIILIIVILFPSWFLYVSLDQNQMHRNDQLWLKTHGKKLRNNSYSSLKKMSSANSIKLIVKTNFLCVLSENYITRKITVELLSQYIYIYMCVCVYIYIDTYIYIYIYIMMPSMSCYRRI